MSGLFLDANAQAVNRDSLFNVWNDLNEPDTDRLKAINVLCWNGYLFSEPDSAYLLAQWQLEFAKEKGLYLYEARALTTQAMVLRLRGEYDEAIHLLKRSLQIREVMGDESGVGRTFMHLGIVYAMKGENANALEYYTRGLGVSERLNDKLNMAALHANMGTIFHSEGDYGKALSHYMRSLKISEEINDDQMANVLGNVGRLYSDQGNHAKAIDYYERSLGLFQKLGSQEGTAGSFVNIGAEHQEQGNQLNAIMYYIKGADIYEEIGDGIGQATCLNNIGSILLDRGEYAEATEKHRRALEINEAIGHKLGIAYSLYYIGIAMRKQGRFDQAVEYGERALGTAREVGDALIIQECAQALYETYKRIAKPSRALAMHELYMAMRDSILSGENQRELARHEFKYEYEKKAATDSVLHAAEITQVNSEKVIESLRANRNRNRALSMGLGAILLLGGGAAYYRVDRKRRQARADRRAAELEIKALRAQMNPHFLFNALNSIHDHILENEAEVAADYLTKFSKLMRQVLESSRLNDVPLARELDILRGYIDLERMRLRDKFDVLLEVAPEVDQESAMLPPLILQPFVENAIWHGLSRKEGKGLLRIEVKQRDDALVVAIQDDGVGRETPKATTGPDEGKTSLGTTITRDRLELLATQRRAHAGFEFVPVAEGTRVEVILPITVS